MSNETSARVEGESGMELSAKQKVLAVYPDATIARDHHSAYYAFTKKGAGGRISEYVGSEELVWESAASKLPAPEPKVGESGLSDEQFVKQVHPQAFASQCWIGCWHIRRDLCDHEGLSKKENSGTIDSAEKAWADARARIEAKPEPLPNTLDVERAENWLKANHDVLRYAQKTPAVRVLAEVLHDYSLTVVAAPNTLQEERIEALLQVVREYRKFTHGKYEWMSRAAAPVALPNLECGDEEHLAPAIKLLADVMHLWVDGYISKNPKSMAPDSISSEVFEAVERLLSMHEIAVDYCGWHIEPVALPTHQVVRRAAGSSAEGVGYAELRCSCGRIFVGLGDEALASSRASFEAHLPKSATGVSKFFGTWPGDETDSELLAALDEIRKPAHLPEKEGK